MKIEHIGIAVKSLEESTKTFEKLFNKRATEPEYVEEQKVMIRKIHLDNCEIELLEGISPESPISKFIEKRGEGIHHCSFSVQEINEELKRIKECGIKLIDENAKRGSDNSLIAFLHPKSTSGVLMELSQKKNT